MNGFWNNGESGNYILKITLPPAHLDANIHPNKIQVKFFKPSIIFSLVSAALKKSLSLLEKPKEISKPNQLIHLSFIDGIF